MKRRLKGGTSILILGITFFSRYFQVTFQTNLLTCRVLLEKLTGSLTVKKFPAFYLNNKVHYRLYKNTPNVPIMSQINPVQAPIPLPEDPASYYHPIYTWISLLQVFQPKPCIRLSSPHMCYMSNPSNSSRFVQLNNIRWGVQIIKLLIMQFSFHSPVTSSPLGQRMYLSTLFSNTISLRSSLNESDQVSHLYKNNKQNYISLYLNKFSEDYDILIPSA